MKNLHTLLLFFYLAWLFILLPFVGCGDPEDIKELSPHTIVTGETEDTPYPPPDWHKTEDPELYIQYFRAQLIKQFGDIPEVHIIVEDERKMLLGLPQTLDEYIAALEAMYHLWPTPGNKKTLEHTRELKANGGQVNIINVNASDAVLIKQLMEQRNLTRKEAIEELKKIRAEDKKRQEDIDENAENE